MLSKKIFKSWRTDICSMAVPYADSVLIIEAISVLFYEMAKKFGSDQFCREQRKKKIPTKKSLEK